MSQLLLKGFKNQRKEAKMVWKWLQKSKKLREKDLEVNNLMLMEVNNFKKRW